MRCCPAKLFLGDPKTSHFTCTAEDPENICGRPRRKPWVEDHTVEDTNLWWIRKFDLSLHLHGGRSAEDLRKAPAEAIDVKAHWATVLHRPRRRKIRESHRGRHLVPLAPFQVAGPGAACLPLLWAPGGQPHMWPPHVAGHQVATNPKK
jgi:hypothetical protein